MLFLTAPLSVESRLPLTSSTVMLVWVFCKSLLKIHHLFSLLGNQSFLFIDCAVQKNIQQILDMAFSLQGFHKKRMPFILRLLRCVLLLPCPEMMEVIRQHLVASSPRWYARAFRSRGDTSLGAYPIRTVIQFSRCIGDLQAQFSEKRYSFPYIQKVGKVRKNAWISTLIEMEMEYATEAHCSGKIERSACRGF